MTKTSHLLEIERLAIDLMRQHLPADQHWTFRWGKGKNRVGVCNYLKREIRLSRFIAAMNPVETARNTILHEIAHALAGSRAGHGPEWKAWCRQLGARPERLADPERVATPERAWVITCSNCGPVGRRHRRFDPRKYSCGRCKKPGTLDLYKEIIR